MGDRPVHLMAGGLCQGPHPSQAVRPATGNLVLGPPFTGLTSVLRTGCGRIRRVSGGTMRNLRTAFAALAVAAFAFLSGAALAQAGTGGTQTPEEVFKSLKLDRGHIDLRGNIAALDLPAGFAYLDPVG